MGSLAREIRQLLEENDVCEESEELDIDEIVGWAMEDDDCEEMDEGCGSKHKSDDDDDDEDDEMDEDVDGGSEELDEARRQKKEKDVEIKATMAEVRQVLDKAIPAYEKMFGEGIRPVKPGMHYYRLVKKGGNRFFAAGLSHPEKGYVYQFHIQVWDSGGIIRIIPEVVRSSDLTVMAQGKKKAIQYSHEKIDPAELAKPKTFFGGVKVEDVDGGSEELQESNLVKAYASMDTSERAMFDQLHMMASNEGRFYPNKPKEAVMYSFKEYMKLKSAEIRDDFATIQKHLVRQLQNDWQTVAKENKRKQRG